MLARPNHPKPGDRRPVGTASLSLKFTPDGRSVMGNPPYRRARGLHIRPWVVGAVCCWMSTERMANSGRRARRRGESVPPRHWRRGESASPPRPGTAYSGARACSTNAPATIRFVETRSESGRRYQCLDPVVEQRLLSFLTAISRLSCVGLCFDSPGLKPFRHLVLIADRERINNAVAGQRRNMFRKSRQPLRLPGQSCLFHLTTAHPNQSERRIGNGSF